MTVLIVILYYSSHLYKNIPLGKLIKSCNFFDYLKFKMAARTHNANWVSEIQCSCVQNDL